MKTLLPGLFLLLTLVSGQWVYAEHQADIAGGNHHHSTDCTVCFAQINEGDTAPSLEYTLNQYHSPLPVNDAVGFVTAISPRLHGIRAPPFNQ